MNARSVKNKDLIISQELNDHKIDIAVITETWLKDTAEDEAWTNQSELTQGNYKVKVHNRPGPQKGGGIALIHRSHYPVKELEKGNTITIEYAVWKTEIKENHYMSLASTTPHQILKTMEQTTCSWMK